MNFVGPNAVICSVSLVAALFLASSATAGLPSKMYHSRVWQAQDGLPQDAVQALAQTADGYLWIGTSGGLIRFDGDRFIIFTRDNTPALREIGRASCRERV